MSINIPFKSGGVFQAEAFVHSQTIASGQTGDLITIGTAGKRTRLTYLLADTGVEPQTGISVTVDGSIVIPIGDLDEENPTSTSSGNIGIYQGRSAGGADSISGVLQVIEGEFITITKDTGNTTYAILYSYLTGVYA